MLCFSSIVESLSFDNDNDDDDDDDDDGMCIKSISLISLIVLLPKTLLSILTPLVKVVIFENDDNDDDFIKAR